MIIGIDLGGTNIRIGAVTEDFSLQGDCSIIPTERLKQVEDPVRVLAELIQEVSQGKT